MKDSNIRHIAEQYASKMGEVIPGFKFGIGEEEEFTNKYYFDFIWLTLDGQFPQKPPVAGGPRGLTVNKHDNQVEMITHGDYGSLKVEERKLTDIYQLLSEFKDGRKHMTDVKAKLGLNSKQLLELSKIIKDTELTKHKIDEIINKLQKQL